MTDLENINSKLIIDTEDILDYNLQVYSITGELLLNKKNLIGRNEFEINSGSGLKIVKVISGNEIITKKLFLKY